MLQFIQKKI